MKKFRFSAAVAVLLVSAGIAYAGAHVAYEVTVLRDASGNATQASGNLADAYNSTDSNQYIGCGGSAIFAWCQAADASDDPDGVNGAYCGTTDPQLIAQVRSISADSYVRFSIDPATGDCTAVSVSHNSFYRPKAP